MAWPLDRFLLRGFVAVLYGGLRALVLTVSPGFLRLLRPWNTVVFPKTRVLCPILLNVTRAHAHVSGAPEGEA
jgi:hypothetical protein